MNKQKIAVKVAVRLRPILPTEEHKKYSKASCITVNPESAQVTVLQDHRFKFDSAFPAESSQELIFETCVRPLLSNIFNGYNATVFAYGQTGSGKTYTMGIENPEKLKGSKGIIPQSIEWIFNQIELFNARNFQKPRIKVSFIEIYKEELHDLLDKDPKKVLHIMENEDKITMVPEMKEEACNSIDEVFAFLKAGTAIRHTGANKMNEYSSRSHCIFTLTLEQELGNSRNKILATSTNLCFNNSRKLVSKVHFVDLAGSERVNKTGNTGKMLRESVYINGGLLALNTVICSLTARQKKKINHIPYRQSKLTRMLKDSLGGNAKTVMICCISPFYSDVYESINTLKYAAKARNIKNNPCMNWGEINKKINKALAAIAEEPSIPMDVDDNTIMKIQSLSCLQKKYASPEKKKKSSLTSLIETCSKANSIFQSVGRMVPPAIMDSIHAWQDDWKKVLKESEKDIVIDDKSTSQRELSGGDGMDSHCVIKEKTSRYISKGVKIHTVEYLPKPIIHKRDKEIIELNQKIQDLEYGRKRNNRRIAELQTQIKNIQNNETSTAPKYNILETLAQKWLKTKKKLES